MLTKEIIVGLVSITEFKQLQVREDTVVLEDLKELSRTYHRYVANPGDDISGKPQLVKDLAGLLWTSEVVELWKEKEKSNTPLIPS